MFALHMFNHAFSLNERHSSMRSATHLEILLLLEEHGETDNRPIDQQAANDGHRHGRNPDQVAMCQQSRKC